MSSSQEPKVFDVGVVGAGAAGVGVSVALQDAGIENFIVLERFTVGAAFAMWPEETRFITPSFPTNSIGMLDLNSVAIGVSPAFGLEVEHPTGKEYAFHLNAIAAFRELPIQPNTTVLRVTKVGDVFLVDTEEETIRAKHVIWAAGEFLYPTTGGFPGIELCRHTATVRRYAELEGDDFVIIGDTKVALMRRFTWRIRESNAESSTKPRRGSRGVLIPALSFRPIRSSACAPWCSKSGWSCCPTRRSLQ